MSVLVRAATQEDRAVAMGLAHRLEEGVSAWRDPAAVAEAVRGWVEGSVGSGTCFVAEEAGQVIGFLSVEAKQHWAGEREAYIGELMVDRSAEGRGVGRALVDEAMRWGRDQECGRIALETGASNAPALAFYDALEFEADEVRLSRAL